MAGQLLFIPTKQSSGQDNNNITIALRSIERWANGLIPGIQQITSVDGTVTVTNPFGPVTDLHAAGGGGGGYLSLTGPGQTATPGDLVQAGGFEVNCPSSSSLGFFVNDNSVGGSGIDLSSASLVSIGSRGDLRLSSNPFAGVSSAVTLTTVSDPGGNLTIASDITTATSLANPSILISAGAGSAGGVSGTQTSGQIFLTVGGDATFNPQHALIRLSTGDGTSPIQFMPFTAVTGLTGTAWGVEMQVLNPTSGTVTGPQLAIVGTRNVTFPAFGIHDYTPASGGVTQSGITITSDHGNIVLLAPAVNLNVTGPGSVTLGSTLSVTGGTLKMWGAAGGSGPANLTGSRGGNVALTNLIGFLATWGFITNSTTP